MSQKADTFAMRNVASRFSASAQAVHEKGTRAGATAVSLAANWQGNGAEGFQKLASQVQRNLQSSSTAIAQIGQTLNVLANQYDQVNGLHQQADSLLWQIHSVENQLHFAEEQERHSLRSELSYLRQRRAALENEANLLESQANSQATAKFHDIEALVARIQVTDQGGTTATTTVTFNNAATSKKEEDELFSWDQLLLPGGVAALIKSKSITFHKSSANPNVFTIRTADWMRGRSSIGWWNSLVQTADRRIMPKLKVTEKTIAKQVKDAVGISANLTRISTRKLAVHMAKRAVGPVGFTLTIFDEITSIKESWAANNSKLQSREQFWQNFSQDAASSVNRVTWRTLGMIGGTALGATIGSFFGPAGSVIGGVVGGALGDSAGKWIADITDWIARKAGEKLGGVSASGLDSFDASFKSHFSSIFH